MFQSILPLKALHGCCWNTRIGTVKTRQMKTRSQPLAEVFMSCDHNRLRDLDNRSIHHEGLAAGTGIQGEFPCIILAHQDKALRIPSVTDQANPSVISIPFAWRDSHSAGHDDELEEEDHCQDDTEAREAIIKK